MSTSLAAERPAAGAAFDGADLVRARTHRGITQRQAAAELHVDPATLRRWEQDRQRPLAGDIARVQHWIRRSLRAAPPAAEIVTPESMRWLQTQRGWSLAEYAAAVGARHISTVSRWLNGHVVPGAKAKAKIERLILEERRAGGTPAG